MKKITKAVIPIGGFGTRLLPITKAIPKEMLPIVDKPVIQYIVEELSLSGIEEVYFIISEDRDPLINYFSRNKRLEEKLILNNKNKSYQEIVNISSIINIHFILDKEQNGSATAINLAKEYLLNEEAFLIVLADDLIRSEVPASLQLIKLYEQFKIPIIGVHKVPITDVNKYGIIKPTNNDEVEDIVEKPSLDEAPSRLASLGRYIVTNDYFKYIKDLKRGVNNEYQLTDVLKLMLRDTTFKYYEIKGQYYDIGTREGHINAIVDYAIESDKVDNDKLNINT